MIFHAFLLLSVLFVVEAQTPPYNPTDVFLFNCGSTSDAVDNNGRNWTVEQRKFMPSNSVDDSFTFDVLFSYSVVPQVPYLTTRVFRSDFTYNFPVSPGWKFLRLHFYPTRYISDFDAVDSFFAVSVNGFTLLNNFSADLTVKASKPESKFLIKEFIIPVNETVNLTFTPSTNSLAFVNGIEILSMPDRLYSKGGFDDMITNVGSDVDFQLENSTAFETVYRLNVGGEKVVDSRMFQQWISDDDFVLSENSGRILSIPGEKINYTEKTPAYIAPEDVYATCRTLITRFNLKWFFTVDAGYNYLVRLHFCEPIKEYNRPGQRIFSIFIENRTAKIETDVVQLTGGPWIPMYLDFKTYVGSESGPKPNLQLSLYPYLDDRPKHYDAILNGVEILKFDNGGNLAAHNPIPREEKSNGNEISLVHTKQKSLWKLKLILGTLVDIVIEK